VVYHVVCRLDEKRRVVDAGPQWIVQTYSGNRWRDVSFCRSKVGLLQCVGQIDPEAMCILEALPAWIEMPTADAAKPPRGDRRPLRIWGPPLSEIELRLITRGREAVSAAAPIAEVTA
jgi:hypothetical protein